MEARHQPRLLDQVREHCRVKYFSLRTEQTYVHWIRRFIYFRDKRHPRVRNRGAGAVRSPLTGADL